MHEVVTASLLKVCVQTESDQHNEWRKITYKVKVNTRLHGMSLRETPISQHVRCESHSVESIARTASSFEVEHIELFGQHCMVLCSDSQTVFRFSRHQ